MVPPPMTLRIPVRNDLQFDVNDLPGAALTGEPAGMANWVHPRAAIIHGLAEKADYLAHVEVLAHESHMVFASTALVREAYGLAVTPNGSVTILLPLTHLGGPTFGARLGSGFCGLHRRYRSDSNGRPA